MAKTPKLPPCPSCGGEASLYSCCCPGKPYSALAICKSCRKEYPLPKVKLKTWPSNPIRISKSMARQAETEWGKLAASLQKGEAQ